MSSNMYGFECSFTWKGRWCTAQIVYRGTYEDNPYSLDYATYDWESMDPVDLAKYELAHRNWDAKYCEDVRIGTTSICAFRMEDDPPDFSWSPPCPTEREVLQVIAEGGAEDLRYGWDT